MEFIFSKLRANQEETLEKIRQSQAKVIVIKAPTGSGKSFYPAQLSAWGHKVLSLVGTKSLQAQYASGYDMSLLYGKGNYDCLKDVQAKMFGLEKLMADDCQIPKREVENCRANCPYYVARRRFTSSLGGVLNYPKFLLDRQLVDDFGPEYLFCDEAHLLSETVVNFVGLEFFWKSKELQKYASPLVLKTVSTDDINNGSLPPSFFIQVREWLSGLLSNLNTYKPVHPQKGGKLSSWKWHKNKVREVDTTLSLMHNNPESWFVECNSEKLLIKPLTARFNFMGLFDKAEKIVLMSATIDQHALRELGVEDYEFITIPNAWPAPLRPVVDMGAPRMGFKSSYQDWQTHSQLIADKLNELPAEWTGLIHTPSRKLAYSLKDNLDRLTSRRIITPPEGLGTEEVYDLWQQESAKNDGVIIASWCSWEGWDCGDDQINIVAKTPFVDFSSPFDKARFMYDGKAGYSRVAATFMQGLGRIRRGNAKDYGPTKFVGICDGNWTRIKSYVNDDILKSVV